MAHEQPRRDVDIFWDFGSCPAPSNHSGYVVVNQIRTLALRLGIVKSFKAYLSVADYNFSLGPNVGGQALVLRSELQSSGVSLIDVPGTKEIADKMLIADMLAHAFDRARESQGCSNNIIMLIAGDPSFSYLLSILRMRNHRVVVLGPGQGPDDDSITFSLTSQANLWLDWNTEIMDNVPSSIPRSTATGGNSASQSTKKLNPTPHTRSDRNSEKMQPTRDHKAEKVPAVDVWMVRKWAKLNSLQHSTVKEPPGFKLNHLAAAWEWDPTTLTNAKDSAVLPPTEREEEAPIVKLKPTVTTPSTSGRTDNLHNYRPRYAGSDWEASSNSTQSTLPRESTPVDWPPEPNPTRSSPANPSEEHFPWEDWPPPQATVESSSSPQTQSRPMGNPTGYFPSDGAEKMSENASIAFNGVAPHFQILIDVLQDFQSEGITSVDRGGNLLDLLQQRNPYILLSAGTIGYKSPFALYLQHAYEAGIISSPTGCVQLAPGYQ